MSTSFPRSPPAEGKPATGAEAKLKAVRWGAEFAFPTADIEQMLNEIERGYQA